MIKISKVTKVYQSLNNSINAIDNLSLNIEKGEYVVITGKSGSGKTSLLNIIGMIDIPDEGEYFFNNDNIVNLKDKEISKLRNDSIGFIFQDFNLIDELTVYENIALALTYRKTNKNQIKSKVREVIEKFNLQQVANSYAKDLSGGESQRTAIGRAIIYSPQLIIADEPTGNLDTDNTSIILEYLDNLNKTGTTIVMVTHDEDIASRAKRVVKIADGKIESDKVRN